MVENSQHAFLCSVAPCLWEYPVLMMLGKTCTQVHLCTSQPAGLHLLPQFPHLERKAIYLRSHKWDLSLDCDIAGGSQHAVEVDCVGRGVSDRSKATGVGGT